MNQLKRCLKYILIVLAPLICLKMANIFISGSYDRTPVRMILIYLIIILLLAFIGNLRLKKFEPLLLLIPMAVISVLCISFQFFNEWTLTPSPFGSYVIFMSTHFWAAGDFVFILFTAYLAKFLIEVVLNIRDAIKGRKEPVTAEGPSEEASLPDQESEQTEIITETAETE